jgi:pantothenate kinase
MNSFLQSISKKNLLISLLITGTVLLMGLTRWKTKRELIRRKKKKKEGSVNIGGIFGMDIGGTLSKIVYFQRKSTDGIDSSSSSFSSSQPSSSSPEATAAATAAAARGVNFDHLDTPAHQQALEEFHLAMKSESVMNGSSGSRDNALSFYSNILGGRLHFLRFETRMMETTIQNLSVTDITDNIKSIGCTGGGAHKYQHIIHESLDINVVTFDELQCLIRGMQFVLMNYSNECYTYRSLRCSLSLFAHLPASIFTALSVSLYLSVSVCLSLSLSLCLSLCSPLCPSLSLPPSLPYRLSVLRYDDDAEDQERVWQRDAKEYVRKVQIPYHVLRQSPFPYLVVNIGSGVSILKVTSPGKFERVSGTSIGGGTYWGLCRLFTRCTTFEEVLDMAEHGDNKGVDMLVSDIYGKGYDQMNLKGRSSFSHS